MLDKQINVNGHTVKLKPYSEKRLKLLNDINKDIQKFIDENPTLTINDVPKEKKAMWWEAKASILWEPLVPFGKGFFESDDFESGLLKDTEDFFITRRLYL